MMFPKEPYIDMSERINKIESEIKQLRRIIDVLRKRLLYERVSEYDNT